MWRYRYPEELYHYGVKGMKWGVRRGPPYPIKKKSVTNSSKGDIIKNAIHSGEVVAKMNSQKQLRHIKSSGHYVEGRSYIDGDLSTAKN